MFSPSPVIIEIEQVSFYAHNPNSRRDKDLGHQGNRKLWEVSIENCYSLKIVILSSQQNRIDFFQETNTRTLFSSWKDKSARKAHTHRWFLLQPL